MRGSLLWKRSIAFIDGAARVSKNPFDQDQTAQVQIARLKGPWHPKIPDYLRKSGAKGLELSFHSGFRSDDPGFLSKLPFIEMFEMPHFRAEDNLAALRVEDLQGLQRFIAPDKLARSIDLTSFPKLQSCTIKWQPKLKSVFDVKGLKRLQIRSLNWKQAPALSAMGSLENLEIGHSGIRSFDPIAGLSLTCVACRCPSVPIWKASRGSRRCKTCAACIWTRCTTITDLTCLAPLQNLEILTIADGREIASVAPLESLQNLKALWIAGAKTTIVDGDLTPLTRLPKLAMLTLGNKRHYSHRVIKKWDMANFDVPDTQLEPI